MRDKSPRRIMVLHLVANQGLSGPAGSIPVVGVKHLDLIQSSKSKCLFIFIIFNPS